MKLSAFNFELPHELIATEPASPRDTARLLVVEGRTLNKKDDYFSNLDEYLQKGDVLVLNNTRVFPARLIGETDTGKEIEVFILEEKNESACLVNPGKLVRDKLDVVFSDKLKGVVSRVVIPTHSATLRAGSKEGSPLDMNKDSSILRNPSERIIRADDTQKNNFRITFNLSGEELKKEIKKIGSMPLPPYILKERGEKLSSKKDEEEYQTVFAKEEGSVAAPTAGLHFTTDLLQKIKQKGVTIVEVTLHVGLGTFEPIREEAFEKHKMHTEHYSMTLKTAEILNAARKEKRRIVAVGTTALRVLETVASKGGFIECSGETDIFIYPGYKFKAVDALITNFHLPKSSLLLLVSAFIGKEETMDLYREAIEKKYRFYSYGDGMLLVK